MYKLKQTPEDFRVTEIMELEPGKEGKYAYYLMWKKNWNTQSACARVARALSKNPKTVNFAGNKDRQAITEQFISVLNGPARGLDMGDIKLEYLGRGEERINLGRADGNRFEIVVRNLDSGPVKLGSVPNYFDVQRFGMNLNNHLVGRLIIQRKFEEAVRLIPGLELKQKGNWLGALRTLPRRTLRLYLHAYQSWLWNQTAMEYLRQFRHRTIEWGLGELVIPSEEIDNDTIPVMGYDTRCSGKFSSITGRILEKDCIRKEQFSIRSIPEADLKGAERSLLADVKGLETGSLEPDELNPGKQKCLLRFSLGKGSYGTLVARMLFGPETPGSQ